MQYWIRQMEISVPEPQNFALADFELHRIIAEASLNPFMRSMIGMIELSHAFAYRTVVDRPDAAVLGELIDIHRTLVMEIDRGHEEGASRAMLASIEADERLMEA